MDSPARTRWQRRKAARPTELTAAALELFVERGFAASRLEDIAARAGVSKGTLYLYFAGKEELFKAVVREALVPALDQGERLISSHRGSASELLREFIMGWWDLVATRPVGGLPKLMVAESRNFPELARFYREEVIERGLALLRTVLRRGVASGEFREMDLEPMQHIVFAPLIMYVVWQHSLGCCGPAPVEGRGYVLAAADFIIAGLRRAPLQASQS